jgi:methylglutaconyl-CoA hydratase
MEAYVKSNIENGIGTIEFFHPQSNSMPGSQLRNLTNEIENLGKNNEVKVIILKSSGEKAFCAGASFDELISIKDFETGKIFFSGFANVINAMRKSPKLIIARIHGKAVGGGVGIACAADYTFATENASVKLSELAVGIGPFVIGPVVEKKIGTSSFAQLAINATEFYSAEWAREKNMYQDVYETLEEMDAEINLLAEKLAKSNPEAMFELKSILWKGTEHWDHLLTERAAVSGQLVLSEFTVNAINQFKKK